MKIATQQSHEEKISTKKMFLFLFAALFPFLLIVTLFLLSPELKIFNIISYATRDIPSITSPNNFELSKIMDLYVKTAPVFSLFVFLLSGKDLRLKKGKQKKEILTLHLFFTFLYALVIYVFLFTNHDMTTSGRIIKMMSSNDLFLTFFYVSLYCSIYTFTYIYLWFCIGTYRIFKEKR